MAGDTTKFAFPIFDGKTDFMVWKMTVEDILIHQGLDDALNESKPERMKDDDWTRMQKKASSTIRLALAPEIKYSVMKEKTAKDIWDKLASIYASKSLTNRLFLKMELYSLKLDEGGNLHDHVNTFNNLICQLNNVDETLKDEEQALLMLASLPKSYKSFVSTMLVGRTTLTLEDVQKALRDNERMIGEHSSRGESLNISEGRGRKNTRGSRGRSKSRDGVDKDKSQVECFYCGEKGHIQNRCPQFREDLKSLRKSKGEASLMEDDRDHLMMESNTTETLKEEETGWVLDSAASDHICNDRAMFDKLQTRGGLGRYRVGNKQLVKIEGVGDVKFKLQDGNEKTVTNVKYVPKASKNMISLGTLTSRGFRYEGDGDLCKVYKGNEFILQGRKNKINLCYLEGKPMRKCEKKKEKKKVTFSNVNEIRYFDIEGFGSSGSSRRRQKGNKRQWRVKLDEASNDPKAK